MPARNPTEATGLHPTARPAEKRQDIEFAEKDAALRQNVHDLGAMIGELLKEQGGDALFDVVEAARRTAIDRREGDPNSGARLDALVHSLSPATARNFIRAFSTYFQVVNSAEQVHRIRRRMDYLMDTKIRQPGGLEDLVFALHESGLDFAGMQALLNTLLIEPVFTADAIEPSRRTILRKQQNIIRRLVDMQNPFLTPRDKKARLESIRAEVTTIWQTEEHSSAERTVFNELEHMLFFMTDVIYRAIPPFYESFEDALRLAYGDTAEAFEIPIIMRFASWIGGDIDGRPDITGRTIRETLARQRALILNLYFDECGTLLARLSQSINRVKISDEITEQIRVYSGYFPNAAGMVPERSRDMLYRTFLKLIMERLQSTYDDDIYPYESADEFLGDLRLIAESLETNKGKHAGLFATRRLMRRVETFGFYFLTLDIRQSALVNRKVIGHCLAEDDWVNQAAAYRTERLQRALERNESPAGTLDNHSKRALGVFQAIAFCRRRYGKRAIGPYIISMAHGVDDILSVLLLARWADLDRKDGSVPLDIAPYFETVEDLADCAETMRLLLQDPAYRTHVAQRDNRQTIMVGYSDSNEDDGLASARWSLQQAQSELVTTLDKAGLEMTLFHGRGGTISRGGGRTHAAVLGSPAGAIRGRLRATEQGELVNAKFGVRGIALRTMEQTTSAVARVTALPRNDSGKENVRWYEVMEVIATASKWRYQSLIYDPPDFYDYFQLATPVDAIERMRLEMRPDITPEKGSISELRVIPWDYAWTQSRHMLPGWFGFGTGLTQAIKEFGFPVIQEMVESWYFFRALIYDVETVLARTDVNIANRYSALAGELHDKFFPVMRTEFNLSVEHILALKKQKVLLEHQNALRRSIRLRNPYVDPMSLLQVDLLRRWRASDRQDEAIFSALIASINGIARGLQDSG